MSRFIFKNTFFLIFCLIQFQFVHAQDYIAVKGGENLTVTIVKIDSEKIFFRQFDSPDTTQYFIQKDNVTAIGFAGNMLKRIKDIQFKNENAYSSVNKMISPDFIYPTGGEMIKVFIENISGDVVQFHIAFANDTNTYFLKKADIDEITFKEISKTQKSEDNLSDAELAAKGASDAYQNYDGYKPAAVGSFVAGMFWWVYFAPVIVPIAVSSVPPQQYSLGRTDPKHIQKPVYLNSYTATAKRIKSNKAWSNFGFGVGASFGLFIGILFLAVSSW